jgi:hypothetical protein
MSDEELSASEPIPAAFAYSAFVAWLALYGSDAELAAAFAVNFAAWGANCGRISAAFKAQYRLGAERSASLICSPISRPATIRL